MPSMTNGQRMNQSVAPTSFMTSTSRRRAKSDSRIVFAIEQDRREHEQDREHAMLSFTTRVAERIFVVSSRRFLTSSIAGSIAARSPLAAIGASASRSLPTLPGSSGVTRNVSGSGLEPSSS